MCSVFQPFIGTEEFRLLAKPYASVTYGLFHSKRTLFLQKVMHKKTPNDTLYACNTVTVA